MIYSIIFDNLFSREESEEEIEVTNIIKKFVVDINGVRCTILYPGENLVSIVQKYDIPLSKLLEYNELSAPNDIKEGDVVYLEKKKRNIWGFKRLIVSEATKLYMKYRNNSVCKWPHWAN